ncbi:hypothetical protein BB65665_02014 [Bacillus sp. 916]|nr:hypothetical protein BB65665_02014 [Bacillus sp. 916]
METTIKKDPSAYGGPQAAEVPYKRLCFQREAPHFP